MDKDIVIEGRIRDGKMDISLSSIFEKLLDDIHLVECYKSDLIIDIMSLSDTIGKLIDGRPAKIVRWLGFRQSGVDHFEYIMCRVFGTTTPTQSDFRRENYVSATYEYRRIFRIEIESDGDKLKVTLKNSSIYEFAKENGNGIVF